MLKVAALKATIDSYTLNSNNRLVKAVVELKSMLGAELENKSI